MTIGTLKIKSKKNKKGNVKKSYEFFYTNSEGQYRSLKFESIPEDQISTSLRQKIDELENASLKVEFEEDGDLIIQLREQGESWKAKLEPLPERSRPTETPKNVNAQSFHNPYNFVPSLPRATKEVQESELGDRHPVGHGRYLPDHWSGRISVKLTTITPLLIPDAAEMTANANNHKTYQMRFGADGKPYLPPTSIKGMLRSAYEAVTNSRFSVFEKHDARLAYRMPATQGTTAKPARVERLSNGLYLRILEDSKCVGGSAKLPRYEKGGRPHDKGEQRAALKYLGTNDLPQHGDRVRVKISTKGKVTHIERWSNAGLPEDDWKLGWVCITGANIGGKQNERVFIQHRDDPKIKITPEIIELWETLIADYQKVHEKDLLQRRSRGESPSNYLGNKPGQTAWSRHVYDSQQKTLGEGILCYVDLNTDNVSQAKSENVVALQPVTISRRLYDRKPKDLLAESLHPATQYDQLSPADRVFGWVNQQGKGSYKGHLRVHSISCISDDPIDNFGSEAATFPLTILGQPKPQQARFYCADDLNGKPIANGEPKEEGYKYDDQALRGRKVYPHHQGLPENYWDHPTQYSPDPMNGHYQEYRQPPGDKEQTDQNRSIKNWVKPGTKFTFDIDVTNLSEVELGALLWLLSDPSVHFHRLGGAKPLGFGSVWLEIVQSDLHTGTDWIDFYSSLSNVSLNSSPAIESIAVYKKAVVSAYANGEKFEQVPFIQAFCRCSQGFDDNAAIHYPRTTPNPTPEGEAFKWFVHNEQDTREELGLKLALPSLAEPRPQNLPLYPKEAKPNNHNRRR
jgi:CRISPR-associated protein (TIGR03986 family)